MIDAEERLKKTVRDTARIKSAYGGFEIEVYKPTRFPWYKTLNLLIEIDHEIWISKKEDKIYIISKPNV
jgi:hypothetical protein